MLNTFVFSVFTRPIRSVQFTELIAVMYDPINYKKRTGYENITHQFSSNKYRPLRMYCNCEVPEHRCESVRTVHTVWPCLVDTGQRD
jgi:hypothetical protein